MEIGGNHIILVSHTDGVRVGIVGSQDRVEITSVAGITPGKEGFYSYVWMYIYSSI